MLNDFRARYILLLLLSDVGESVLRGCQDNIAMNSHLFKYGMSNFYNNLYINYLHFCPIPCICLCRYALSLKRRQSVTLNSYQMFSFTLRFNHFIKNDSKGRVFFLRQDHKSPLPKTIRKLNRSCLKLITPIKTDCKSSFIYSPVIRFDIDENPIWCTIGYDRASKGVK